MLQSILPIALAAEPATILYLVTGAVGFACATLRKSRSSAKSSSTMMLICKAESRASLNSLELL